MFSLPALSLQYEETVQARLAHRRWQVACVLGDTRPRNYVRRSWRSSVAGITSIVERQTWSISVCTCTCRDLSISVMAVDARAGGKPDRLEWKRQRGRPCRTWVQQIEDDTWLNANDAWMIAHDRKSWRALRPVAGQAFHWLTDWLLWLHFQQQ